MAATYDDAGVLVQLLRLDNDMGLGSAMTEIFNESFDPEKASTEDPSIRKVLFFGEVVGALVKHHVLDRDLVRDIYWFDGMWPKVAPHALAARERANEPKLYENFESLVTMELAT
ncbi:MAG TPA: DUF4760 domain-containing protein [Acidimicrobiales bacterium]|nr:DUF4760 domain-containing protein [Acidimicrobiales bacterium]